MVQYSLSLRLRYAPSHPVPYSTVFLSTEVEEKDPHASITP
jgi:hypothetical protein